MYQAVLFDFDYTLGDSTQGIILSVNYGLAQLGYPAAAADAIRKTIGLSLKNTFAVLTGSTNEAQAVDFARYFKEKADGVMVDHTQIYASAGALLQQLKECGCHTGIVTTKYHYRIAQILEKFGLTAAVDLIVGAEDVKMEKPDPQGVLWAVSQLQMQKENVLYVGDSLVDAQTAAAAAIDFAGVLTGTTAQTAFMQYPSVCIAPDLKGIRDFLF